MKKFCKIPRAISHQKLINFFNNENLKVIIDSSKGKDLNINDMKVSNPYKPQLKDLYSLYQIVFLNKRTTILEFGSGWSTLIFSVAMKKLKEKYSKQILKLRRNNKFEVFSVENEKKFLQISKKRIKKYFKNKNYIKNNFQNEKKWLSKVKLISRNFTKYSKIRLKAFNYAKKYNIDWRTKKIMSFINMS